MIGKRIALVAAASALPLAALAPASASAAEQRASSDYPSVYIQKVNYYDDYFNVKLKYRCYSKDDHDYKWGKLNVKVSQKHASYKGWDHAKCDGYWHDKWVYAYKHYGDLKSGKLWVDARVTDYYGKYDTDSKVYYVKFKDHDHH